MVLPSSTAESDSSAAGQVVTVPAPQPQTQLPAGITRSNTPEVQGASSLIATSNVSLVLATAVAEQLLHVYQMLCVSNKIHLSQAWPLKPSSCSCYAGP